MPAGVRKPGGVREMYLNLSWTPKTAQPFVGLLDEVAYDQFVIPVNTLKQHKWVAGAVRSDGYKVYNDRATLIFSSETGALISYMTDGQECWQLLWKLACIGPLRIMITGIGMLPSLEESRIGSFDSKTD